MRVGISYDLKSDYLAEGYSEEEAAEFDSEETIAGIEYALKANGYFTERIGNVKSLLNQVHEGKRWDIAKTDQGFTVTVAHPGGGKIPLLPEYYIGKEGGYVQLKNYTGKVYKYPDFC